MADKRISDLNSLAQADVASGDLLAIVDVSASETKKTTVSALIGAAVSLVADGTIPSGKITFASGAIAAAALATDSVITAKIAADAVTAAKLADNSAVIVNATVPATGDFIGQICIDTDLQTAQYWSGSAWVDFAGNSAVITVTGSSSEIVNITATKSGNTVTLATTLDNTSAANQFLAGPTGGAGAPTYRVIAASDMPAATTSARGSVQVNGQGLRMNSSTIEIDNDVTAVTDLATGAKVITYNAKGLVTGSRALAAGDYPIATSSVVGVVRPGTGLAVDGAGTLDHTNTATAGTYTKVTIDTQGHVTTGATLVGADLPNHSASLLTSGTLDIARIASNTITGVKLANSSTALFGDTQPTAEYTGQLYFNSLTRDIYIWDSNVWQPIGISVGEIVFAGTYDANTNLVASVTSDGSAVGLTVGAALPAASTANNRYYLVVAEAGTGTAPAPTVALSPPDIILSNGSAWTEIDVSQTITAQVASNVSVTPVGDISATNVQAALQEVDSEKLAKAGGTMTGGLLIGTTGTFGFEGSTDNAYETYLAVVDPTADRTITFPDATGTVVLSGSIVNADIDAAAAIAFSKLASLTSGNILVGNGSNVATSVAVSGDVTLSNAGVATVVSGTTSTAGKLQLTDSTSSTSTTTAATPNAVKTAYDLANGKPGLDTAQTWTKGQRGEITALTDGATITPDFADSNNFSVTLGGNRTLANPSNLTAGQSGCIWITQDGTGSRTLSYGSYWDFTGGTAPTLTTTASAVDCLVYAVQSSTKITATLITNLS